MSLLTDVEVLILAFVIGVLFAVGIPVIQLVEYHRLVRKYGKDIAEEILRRY